MKVIGIVGYVVGMSGTGNVFEIEDNGQSYLATIWTDNKFHPISFASVKQHVSEGKGKLNSNKIFSDSNVDIFNVENPSGWPRIYQQTPGIPEESETETEISDSLEFPFVFTFCGKSFDGKVKIDIGDVSKILKMLN